MSNSNKQAQVEPSIMGALTGMLRAGASATTNGFKMIDNAMVAGERITYIASSKASNLAEISDTADTLKLVLAKRELADQMAQLNVTIDPTTGEMVFG